MKRNKTKTILLTGASRGIGKELALRYASQYTTLILIAKNRQKLEIIARECIEKGAKVMYSAIDIKRTNDLKDYIQKIDDHYPIDLVIANAGAASTLQPDWHKEKELDTFNVINTNFLGTINTISPLIERMRYRLSGQIVIISSIAALRPLPQSPSYCATKSALLMYGQCLRISLSMYNVMVNVVCPGFVKTDMSDKLSIPKPFMLTAEEAAFQIEKGVSKNMAVIVFPWQVKYLLKILSYFPSKLVNYIVRRFEI